jgi:urate oxidase
VKIVDEIDEAIDHINRWGSKHTDAIVSSNIAATQIFVEQVDTANAFINCSTRFSDGGEYGLGAEIGISTDKLHSRGPMGAADLTTYRDRRVGRRSRRGDRARPRRRRRHRQGSICEVGQVIELGPNRYGKAAIRVVRVIRGVDGDRLRDLTVSIALEGDFGSAHTDGDNTQVIATDTMKNTAYAFAKDHLDGSLEAYGQALASHFARSPQVDVARVEIRGHHWSPIDVGGHPAPDAFVRGGEGTRIAVVTISRSGTTVQAGVEDLVVLKTTRSSFTGFPRDRYTSLAEAADRLMATKITAVWRYGSPAVDDDTAFLAVRTTLLELFADHDSRSVQESVWIMARAILARHEEVDEVRMVLPNLHHWLVDLSPFGLDNDGEIFVATTEPHGVIEATVRRGDA